MPGLRVYVTVFLFRDGSVLLMRRSHRKVFAPGFWTGVGGRVEAIELDSLEAAARREVEEETGLTPEQIGNLRLRAVDTRLESGDVSVIFFYSAQTDADPLGGGKQRTDEGELHWRRPDELADIEMIPNARRAIETILSGSEGVVFLEAMSE